ncbi:type II secretion system protein [Bacillus tianshenii]|nr:type II secretion system protein [Bacillus tianshenii]
MVKKFKALLKNNRGLTLIELLAVIVILGIIAAIAVPSIGNIIDNSKRDAHIANAEQMVSAARLAKAANVMSADGDSDATNDVVGTYTMKGLVKEGFLENVPEAPGNAGAYVEASSKVVVSEETSSNKDVYTVSLDSEDKDYYIKEKTISDLRADGGRDEVKLDGSAK